MDPDHLFTDRNPKLTEDRLELFFAQLRAVPNVSAAARAVGLSPQTIHKLRADDPGFAQDMQDALDEGVDAMEYEAHRRAFQGIPGRPVVNKGFVVREMVEYSDGLATLLLRAHRPAKYRDQVNVSAEMSGSVKIDAAEASVKIAALLRVAAARRDADDIL